MSYPKRGDGRALIGILGFGFRLEPASFGLGAFALLDIVINHQADTLPAAPLGQ